MATSQAANLSGLLSDIGGTLGKMGEPGQQYVDTFRTLQAPNLDMEDPQSMANYANYLDRNNRKEEAMALRAKVAERKGKLRGLDGEARISNIAATITQDTSQAEREIKLQEIARIAQQYEIPALTVGTILEDRAIARRGATVAERGATTAENALTSLNTQRGIENILARNALDQEAQLAREGFRTQLNMNLNDNVTRENINAAQILSAKELADLREKGLGERQIADIAYRKWERSQIETGLNTRLSANLGFNYAQLAEQKRMNSAQILGIEADIAQGWEGLELQAQRDKVAEALANEEISMSQFTQLIMGDENDRANGLFDATKALKEADVLVALTTAGVNETQIERFKYENNFAKKTEDLRIDALELDNAFLESNIGLTDAQIEKAEAETESERARPDFIEAQVNALRAGVELDRDRFEFQSKRDLFAEGLAEAQLKVDSDLARSNIKLNDVQGRAYQQTINSQVLADEIIVADLISKQVSQTYKDVMAASINLKDPNSIKGARRQYLRMHPGAGHDFDQAILQRIATQELVDNYASMSSLRENQKPATDAQLEAAGFTDVDIDQFRLIGDPASRTSFIQTWVAKQRNPNLAKPPNTEQYNFHEPAAERIVETIFPGWIFGLTDVGNKVDDGDVRAEVQLAMARASINGLEPNEIMLAGIQATYPYINQAGDAQPALSGSIMRERYGRGQQ